MPESSFFPKSKKNKETASVHFIGIGGIGMSALAQWFLSQNWAVSGSDVSESPITQKLAKMGVKVKIGHKKDNLPDKTSLVVFNQAILKENPEYEETIRRKISIKSYPEIIGELTKKYKTISISGAHGKSSSTALASLSAIEANLDPTVIVGTLLKEFSSGAGNFRPGKSEWLILEADEFGRAFLNYFPFAALITNIDKEHLDTYKDLSDIKKTFLKFFNNILPDGILVLNKDNKNLRSLSFEIKKLVSIKELNLFWYSLNSPAARKIKKILQVKGWHNLSNATGVFTLLKAVGLKEQDILAGFKKYSGCWRRFELKGKFFDSGADIIDDYAHHPEEIKATLEMTRETYPQGKIFVVFQPHHQGRLTSLFSEFTKAFKNADNVFILDTYKVAGREKEKKEEKQMRTASDLALAIKAKYVKDPSSLPSLLKDTGIKKGDVIIMMGAGNINLFTEKLLNGVK